MNNKNQKIYFQASIKLHGKSVPQLLGTFDEASKAAMAYDAAATKAKFSKSELNFPIESTSLQKMKQEQEQLKNGKIIKEEKKKISQEKEKEGGKNKESRERDRESTERTQTQGNETMNEVSVLF